MGGFGSGRWDRYQTRPVLDALPRLAVGTLLRLRLALCLRYVGEVETVSHQAVIIQQTFPRASRVDRLPLTWTAQPTGGTRPYFLCPRCQRRASVLWEEPSTGWQCRKCVGRPYRSEQVPKWERAQLQLRKVRRRLGVTRDLHRPLVPGDKPPRMRWQTFTRLRARDAALRKALMADVWQWLHTLSR